MSPSIRAGSGAYVVLAAVEGAFAARVAVLAARSAAEVGGAELHLIHVMSAAALNGSEAAGALAAGRARLQRTGSAAQQSYSGRIVTHLAAGDTTHEILRTAARLRADRIVVGAHAERPLDRLLHGSVVDHLVREASCPVLVVRDKDYSAVAPEIEPPCPECLAAHAASHGASMWCARHSEHHPRGHTYSAREAWFSLGSSILRP